MATSPIYSWPEPDNTDLVKNGALAIRTLGDAIDTTMGTMVAKTIVDAKGDLIAATAADTVARLAVGTNGQTLVADSSTATGLAWATAAGGGKLLQLKSTQITSYVQIASTTMTDTNITASITPTSATSKILVTITACIRTHVNTATNPSNSKFNIVRGATTLVNWLDGRFFQVLGDGFALITVQYLDSPATTSATTYKAQGSVDSTADGRYVEFQLSSYPSTITLMEIGA